MKYDQAFFDTGIDRRGTCCVKWDDQIVRNVKGVPLWVADMDFSCAEPIGQAVLERAKHFSYGYNLYDPEGEEAFCAFWRRRHGLSLLPRQTKMLPCVVTGLKAGIRAFTDRGDKVAIFTPVYGPFFDAIRNNKREIVEVPLLRDAETGQYEMNLSGMEEALKVGTKLILLCNPQNPVSRVWGRKELSALCALANRYQVKIISDEIHADFVYAPRKFTPILSLPEARENCVMLCAASKTFNLAGLQQATTAALNPELLSAISVELEAAGVTSGNTFALCATKVAYNEGDEWLDGLMAYLDGTRKLLPELIKEYLPQAKLTPIEATYLAWLDLTAYGKTCTEMMNVFQRHGAILSTGDYFGANGEGFMRVNFGCPRAQLTEGIRRMKTALEE